MNLRTPMAGGSRGHLPSIAVYLRIHLPISSRAGNAASPLKEKPLGPPSWSLSHVESKGPTEVRPRVSVRAG